MKEKLPVSMSSDEAMNIAKDAYIYGLPLVLMDVTREVFTSVPSPDGRKAPMNQFLHLRAFPDPTFTDVVSPNADTLYSSAWIDLSKEPIVLSVPAMNRYYLMPILDAWTNVFASPGTRTTGNDKGDFAIVGPWWRGKLPVNGWDILPDNTAAFGTDYDLRALVAAFGLGANLPEDAIYPRATTDIHGNPLNGKNAYMIRFQKGQLPPVHAFWSITAYNSKQFFIPNPINRYAIGDRDKLKMEPDGSLTIHITNASPGPNRESNWLPVPSDEFNLVMRLYWPKREIVNVTVKIPGVERVGGQ